MQIEFGRATKYSFAKQSPKVRMDYIFFLHLNVSPLAPMQIQFGIATKHSFAKQSPKVRRDYIFFLHLHVPHSHR